MISIPDISCFYDANCINNNVQYILPEPETHHALHVLRLKLNDSILVSNGKGTIYQATIVAVKRNEVAYCTQFEIVQNLHNLYKHSIACGVLSSTQRMEWMIEKLVEIGINDIIFFTTKRSQRKKIKLQRLEKVAISALKQSKKAFKPNLSLIDFEQLLKVDANQKFVAICDDSNYLHLSNQLETSNALTVIGPEGDFEPNEVNALLNNNFKPCALGNERLRSETAAIYALTCKNLKTNLH